MASATTLERPVPMGIEDDFAALLDATLGDIRASLVLNDRSIGQISVRDIDVWGRM